MLKEEGKDLISKKRPIFIKNLTPQGDSHIKNLTLQEIPEISEGTKKRKRLILLSMLSL
jgi:hypothetical protein